MKVYQVSDQCMGLVSAGIIASAKDESLLKIKKTTKRYIPDILYRKIDKYKNNVITKADPTFPTEFFIIPLRQSAAKDPKPLFRQHKFPIEHRENQVQTLALAKQHTEKLPFNDALSDFHFLLYIFNFLTSQPNFNEKSLLNICNYVVKKERENDVKLIFQDIFKSVQAQPPKPTQNPPTNAKEQQIIDQLVAMGYNATQAKEAVWATGSSGVEQAMDFLLK